MHSERRFWWKPCKAEIFFLHFHQGHRGNEENIQTKHSCRAEEAAPPPRLCSLPSPSSVSSGFHTDRGGAGALPNPFSLDDYSSTDTGTLTRNPY